MQVASADGLQGGTTHHHRHGAGVGGGRGSWDGGHRCLAMPLHNARQMVVSVLRETWEGRSAEEAAAVLAKPDVLVTNQSDKDLHLPKLFTLERDVREAWGEYAEWIEACGDGDDSPRDERRHCYSESRSTDPSTPCGGRLSACWLGSPFSDTPCSPSPQSAKLVGALPSPSTSPSPSGATPNGQLGLHAPATRNGAHEAATRIPTLLRRASTDPGGSFLL